VMVDREELDGAEIISAPKMNEQVNAVRWNHGFDSVSLHTKKRVV
jgi:hypothetical protein